MSRRNSLVRAEARVELPANFDVPGLNAFVEMNLLRLAGEIAAEAKATSAFRDRTGNLRKSIKVQRKRIDGEDAVIVRATSPHAHLVEYGTAGPRVSKREGGLLFLDGVYGQGGEGVFAREVGPMPAKPFLRPALLKVMAKYMAGFRAGSGVHAEFAASSGIFEGE